MIDFTQPSGWFPAYRNPLALELIRANPNAFILAYVIATRARWQDGRSILNDLGPGEALIGDFDEMGMSEQQYRTAKKVLERSGIATFQPTPLGTIARLCSTAIFGTNVPMTNEPANGQSTDGQRLIKKEKKDNKENKEKKAVSDDEWIEALEREPANQGINVKGELARMRQWCLDRGRTPSRRRFANWLLKCDRPLVTTVSASAQPEHQTGQLDIENL